MGLGVGSVTIDGILYNQIALRPEINLGKLGIGLDLVFYMDNEGNMKDDEWDFGNGQFSVVNDNSPQSTDYEDFGTYTVWLIADNGLCNDSTSLIITTTIEPWIFVPNVFIPTSPYPKDPW